MSNNPGGKPTTQIPHVDPRVTDPRAQRYAKEAAARRPPVPQIPKYDAPVAGGATPPIPILDSPHVDGRTMAEQAEAMRAMHAPQGGIFQSPPDAPQSQQGMPPPPPLIAPPTGPVQILPQDMLPPEAMQDPMFQHGQGSQYASAQPGLARKYGVVRNGQRLPPQALAAPAQPGTPAAKKKLSPETIEGLRTFEQLQRQGQQKAIEDGDKEAENASRASSAGEAAKLGGGISSSKTEPSQMLDELDLDAIHNRMVQNLLQNEEQRKIIEERLPPMDLSMLITQGYISQVVPVQPGIFEPEFKSISAEDDLAIKRLIVEEANSLKVDDRYLLDKFGIMGLTLSLHAINKKPMPDHHDSEGKFSDELFWKKFNRVIKFPLPMIASLGTHYFYFDVRVRKLFVAERIKNG